MATKYWVGGTGTWNTSSTTNWSATSGGASGASVPTSTDNVIFDRAATYTVTLTGALTCLNITVSAGTVTFSSTGTLAVSGSMSLVAATVWNATGVITFNSTSAGNTITTNGVTLSNSITFNGAGGSWQLQNALTITSNRVVTLTNGTLDLNGQTLSTGQFSSSNSNARVLSFDGFDGNQGFIYLTSASTTSNVTIFTTSDSTNFTITGSGNVYVTGAPTSFIRSITPGLTNSGGSIATALSFFIEAGSDTINLGTANRVFLNLQFNTFTGILAGNVAPVIYGGLRLSTGMTITGGTNAWVFEAGTLNNDLTILTSSVIDNPITFSGTTNSISGTLTLGSTRALTLTNGTLLLTAGTTNTVGSFVTTGTTQKYLRSTIAGTQATISAASGTNTVTNLTIQDSNATGGAIWDAQSLTNVNAGNNTGWFLPPTPAISNEITMRLRSFTQPRRF